MIIISFFISYLNNHYSLTSVYIFDRKSRLLSVDICPTTLFTNSLKSMKYVNLFLLFVEIVEKIPAAEDLLLRNKSRRRLKCQTQKEDSSKNMFLMEEISLSY